MRPTPAAGAAAARRLCGDSSLSHRTSLDSARRDQTPSSHERRNAYQPSALLAIRITIAQKVRLFRNAR